ncbi:hypothetical protein ACJX0J_028931, partial [Zea mays]
MFLYTFIKNWCIFLLSLPVQFTLPSSIIIVTLFLDPFLLSLDMLAYPSFYKISFYIIGNDIVNVQAKNQDNFGTLEIMGGGLMLMDTLQMLMEPWQAQADMWDLNKPRDNIFVILLFLLLNSFLQYHYKYVWNIKDTIGYEMKLVFGAQQ